MDLDRDMNREREYGRFVSGGTHTINLLISHMINNHRTHNAVSTIRWADSLLSSDEGECTCDWRGYWQYMRGLAVQIMEAQQP